jgi:cell wall-associated NlpC family hydrolase
VAGRTDGLALAMIGAGALFAYAGIRGKSVPAALTALITGKSPATAAAANPITGVSGSGATSPVGSTSEIAAAALKYDGTHNYKFGAPPPAGMVDCSSWATDVIGHDCGLPVPGGTWAKVTNNGTTHGPDTIEYLSWSGAETVGHHSSVAQPGDLAVWQTHMGIVIGPNQMISAQDPAHGTGKSVIDGAIPGELLFIRRIIIGGSRG